MGKDKELFLFGQAGKRVCKLEAAISKVSPLLRKENDRQRIFCAIIFVGGKRDIFYYIYGIRGRQFPKVTGAETFLARASRVSSEQYCGIYIINEYEYLSNCQCYHVVSRQRKRNVQRYPLRDFFSVH